MHKKGQAALEFLTTYGWAFLVILVMIGALAYFGVLNPSRFVPETCTFGSSFECQDAVLSSDNLTLKLRNNLEALNITQVVTTDIDSGAYVTNTTGGGAGSITVIQTGPTTDPWFASGETFELVIKKPLDAVWNVGAKKKISVDLTYFMKGSPETFIKSVGGDIVATVNS